MKILLIQPPIRDFYDTEIRLQPLGLCMLKAVIKKHLPDVEVIVKDYHQGYERKTLKYPSELSYLKPFYPYHDAGPFSMFHHFYHFGATYEAVTEDVIREGPDMVGISSLFTAYANEALACANEIKRQLNIPIVMGGPHVSALPLEVLKDPNVDFVIRGEGERPLVELLRAFESGGTLDRVPNLGFKRDTQSVLNPLGEPYDFQDLPWPDFSDFPFNRYLFEKRPLCFMMTSRGCPHHCTFCSVHQTFGKKFSRRRVSDIVSEIQERYRQGYRVFDFEDDNLTFDREDFKTLLGQLMKSIPAKEIRFMAMNGVSYMSLDQDILEMMKAAGFKSLNLSLVTANPYTLAKVRRPHTVEKFLDVVRQAHDLGFGIVAYQILGLPDESLADMIETMTLLAGLPVLIGVSIFYLVPGCSMAKKSDFISPPDRTISRSTAMAIETGHVSRDDLYTLFITARIINFIKGIWIDEKEMSIDDALDRAESLGKREKTGVEILRRLFKEKVMHAATGNGLKPLPRFRSDLFSGLWDRLHDIVTQKGGIVSR
ncbi:MAG: radical SAM protein [Deltaproteobacteria bacterium]|nr:radical SAM protein [Deltaproteobacteria bacterium]